MGAIEGATARACDREISGIPFSLKSLIQEIDCDEGKLKMLIRFSDRAMLEAFRLSSYFFL